MATQRYLIFFTLRYNLKISVSFELAKSFINSQVTVTVDRQLGSKHPKWDFVYTVNSGYIKGVKAPDGEDLDAYVIGVDYPVETYEGTCIAIIHRTKDDDDKLVVVPANSSYNNEEIEKAVSFQEQWFEHEIIRG